MLSSVLATRDIILGTPKSKATRALTFGGAQCVTSKRGRNTVQLLAKKVERLLANDKTLMQLMTKELEKRFAKVGSQEEVSDPIVIAKFFNPCGAGTWYATVYDPIRQVFFGYVSIFGDHNDEWGSFSLRELEEYTRTWGAIERDLNFKEQPISSVMPKGVLINEKEMKHEPLCAHDKFSSFGMCDCGE